MFGGGMYYREMFDYWVRSRGKTYNYGKNDAVQVLKPINQPDRTEA